jgi:hypothetical protein
MCIVRGSYDTHYSLNEIIQIEHDQVHRQIVRNKREKPVGKKQYKHVFDLRTISLIFSSSTRTPKLIGSLDVATNPMQKSQPIGPRAGEDPSLHYTEMVATCYMRDSVNIVPFHIHYHTHAHGTPEIP